MDCIVYWSFRKLVRPLEQFFKVVFVVVTYAGETNVRLRGMRRVIPSLRK